MSTHGRQAEPGREYHRFYRDARFRWWRPIVALLLASLIWAAATVAFTVAAMLIDAANGVSNPFNTDNPGPGAVTPLLFAANNLALAACIPAVFVAQRAVFGYRPGWLSSVAGWLRWRWLLICVAVSAPLWIILVGLQLALGGTDGLAVHEHTVFLILVIVLTTPFQAAGEEYLIRGLLTRCVGAYGRDSNLALVVAALVGAGVFAVLHGAGDPWLNVFYLAFGLIAASLVWRTGGVEAAIALHAVNNVIGLSTIPFSDVATVFEREAGTANAAVLVQLFVVVAAAGIILWLARRTDIQTVYHPSGPTPATRPDQPEPRIEPPTGPHGKYSRGTS